MKTPSTCSEDTFWVLFRSFLPFMCNRKAHCFHLPAGPRARLSRPRLTRWASDHPAPAATFCPVSTARGRSGLQPSHRISCRKTFHLGRQSEAGSWVCTAHVRWVPGSGPPVSALCSCAGAPAPPPTCRELAHPGPMATTQDSVSPFPRVSARCPSGRERFPKSPFSLVLLQASYPSPCFLPKPRPPWCALSVCIAPARTDALGRRLGRAPGCACCTDCQ